MNLPVPKILVVDDTPANLVAMRHVLADSGAQLYEARSGNDALALCLDHEFALILLDVNMPEMDGFEVAFLIGEDERLRDTPIIFVTAAYADDINRVRGYHFGAVDYIAKPINDMILQSKVRVFLELYRARAQLKSTLAELEERNEQLNLEIAERLRIEDRIRHQATHDMLTGPTARCSTTACLPRCNVCRDTGPALRWPCSISMASRASTTTTVIRLAMHC
jgi:CheY-like chemotaxis protein